MVSDEAELMRDVGALMEQEQWELAIELCSREPDWVLQNATLLWEVGWAYLKISNFSMAIEFLRKAVDIQPGKASAHWALGVALKESGNLKDAEVSLLRAIALRDSYLSRMSLGTLYLVLRQERLGEAIHREGVRLRPDVRERWEALSDFLSDIQDEDGALQAMTEAEHLPRRKSDL